MVKILLVLMVLMVIKGATGAGEDITSRDTEETNSRGEV